MSLYTKMYLQEESLKILPNNMYYLWCINEHYFQGLKRKLTNKAATKLRKSIRLIFLY